MAIVRSKRQSRETGLGVQVVDQTAQHLDAQRVELHGRPKCDAKRGLLEDRGALGECVTRPGVRPNRTAGAQGTEDAQERWKLIRRSINRQRAVPIRGGKVRVGSRAESNDSSPALRTKRRRLVKRQPAREIADGDSDTLLRCSLSRKDAERQILDREIRVRRHFNERAQAWIAGIARHAQPYGRVGSKRTRRPESEGENAA